MNNISNQLNIKNLIQTKWTKQFSPTQLYQIKLGFHQNIDVTIYAKPEFNHEQMREIRLGLENKLDVSYYTNPKFNSSQMREILLGL